MSNIFAKRKGCVEITQRYERVALHPYPAEGIEHKQKNNGANDCGDQGSDEGGTTGPRDADEVEKEAADHRPQHADDDIADDAKARAAHDFTGDPAGNATDDEKPENVHGKGGGKEAEEKVTV